MNKNSRFDDVSLFGMRISRVSMPEAVQILLEWCTAPRCEVSRFVVTPNVDHAVMFQEIADLRAAYEDASLVLADGLPLVISSRLFGRKLPERVAGSDVVPAIFAAATETRRLRVFLLGAAPGVADAAAVRIQEQYPNVRVVGTCSPPKNFEQDEKENEAVIAALAEAEHDLLIVGLGAPRQEMWVHRHRDKLPGKVAICAGATIDFLAGNRSRSPVWMRKIGLEWFHRVCSEPRRLARRYGRDAWVFPQLLWREWHRSSCP
jgi:N-acetylglucosaminyldiphosphoundecaprenol N-acetyl-beta-D-mannosaminyltransferase